MVTVIHFSQVVDYLRRKQLRPYFDLDLSINDVEPLTDLMKEYAPRTSMDNDCYIVERDGFAYLFQKSCTGSNCLLPLFCDVLAETNIPCNIQTFIEICNEVSSVGKEVVTGPVWCGGSTDDVNVIQQEAGLAIWGVGGYEAYLKSLPKKSRYKLKQAADMMSSYGATFEVLSRLDDSDFEWVLDATRTRWETEFYEDGGSDNAYEIAIIQWLYGYVTLRNKFFVKIVQDGETLAIGCFVQSLNGTWTYNSFAQYEFLDGIGVQMLVCAMIHLTETHPTGCLSPTTTYLPGYTDFYLYKKSVVNTKVTAFLVASENGSTTRYKSLEEFV